MFVVTYPEGVFGRHLIKWWSGTITCEVWRSASLGNGRADQDESEEVHVCVAFFKGGESEHRKLALQCELKHTAARFCLDERYPAIVSGFPGEGIDNRFVWGTGKKKVSA